MPLNVTTLSFNPNLKCETPQGVRAGLPAFYVHTYVRILSSVSFVDGL